MNQQWNFDINRAWKKKRKLVGISLQIVNGVKIKWGLPFKWMWVYEVKVPYQRDNKQTFLAELSDPRWSWKLLSISIWCRKYDSPDLIPR